ncbi:MAG: phosphoribosylformylglycinamidine cyclo-ligase [Dehalococcoidia bacterium]
MTHAASYAAAGVDIDATNRAVERMKALATGASRPEVMAGIGPFAAMFRMGSYREPVLVSSTDGVGTKVKIARALGRYDSVGRDLVNHCVNDILTAGAEPLFFLDYLASSSLTEDQKVALVEGMADACREAGCALVGGETADMPDMYADGDFDIAGFIVGVAERDALMDGSRIRPGDVLLALPSNGLHTNGYSLVRRVFDVGRGGSEREAHDRATLERFVPELGSSLGDALLVPHHCYLSELLPVLQHLKAMAHITGGGLIENVPRILPDGVAAVFDLASWQTPPLFGYIQRAGNVPDGEMFRTFNMGVGMVLAVDPASRDLIVEQGLLPDAWEVGCIIANNADGPRVLLH